MNELLLRKRRSPDQVPFTGLTRHTIITSAIWLRLGFDLIKRQGRVTKVRSSLVTRIGVKYSIELSTKLLSSG